MTSRAARYLAGFALLVTGLLLLAVFATTIGVHVPTLTTAAASVLPVQDNPGVPEVTVLPEALNRLSWGAVIAGTLITLILMFILNLIGIAVGFAQVQPAYGDSPDAGGLALGGLIWVGVTNLVALFAGGWLAAYFAGIPEPVDGLLHGMMVWALSGIVTVLLVASGIGRVMNGLASLVASGLNLTGSLASTAGQVAGSTVQAGGQAVGGVAGGIGNLTAQTLSVLANGIQNSAQLVGQGLQNVTDSAIENAPDVQNALKYQNLTLDDIRIQAERLMRQAGVDPRQVENQANAAAADVRTAAQEVARHPEHADEILSIALQRVFRHGEDVANDVDREALVNLLGERANLSPEAANQQIQRWETQFNQVKDQTRQVRDAARQKAEELRQQAEQRAQEVYQEAQNRVAEMQREAEERLMQVRLEAEQQAREAAQTASQGFAKVAAGIAAALVIGAVAAGIGGYIGAPESLPDVPVDEASGTNSFSSLAGTSVVVETLE